MRPRHRCLYPRPQLYQCGRCSTQAKTSGISTCHCGFERMFVSCKDYFVVHTSCGTYPVVSSLDRACTCELSRHYKCLVAMRQPLSRGFCGSNYNGACSSRGKVEAGAPLPPDQEFRRVLANAGCKGLGRRLDG